MARNSHIRPQHVEKICHLIYGWSAPEFNWLRVCNACKPILGYAPSRSGLSSHAAIQVAFRSRKDGLREQRAKQLPLPNSRAAAGRTIASRDAEIAALKLQVKELMDKLVRWQYNASLRRVTPEMLDDPSTYVAIDRVNVIGRSGGARAVSVR
jgi:hypothetical protein